MQTLEFAHWLYTLKNKRAQLRIDIRIRWLADRNLGEHRDLEGGLGELKIREDNAYRALHPARWRIGNPAMRGDKSSETKQQAGIAKAQRLAANLGETDEY